MENKNNTAIEGGSFATPASSQGSASLDQMPTLGTTTPVETPITYTPPASRSRLARRYIIAIILFVLLLVIGGLAIYFNTRSSNNSLNSQGVLDNSDVADRYGPLSISLDDLAKSGGGIAIDGVPSLAVNGQLRANNSLIVSPTAQPTGAVAGQIYYDNTTNRLRYYDGTQFTDLLNTGNAVQSLGGVGGNISLGGNLSIVNGQLTAANNGVASIQGQTGNVNFTSGGGIAIDGTTLTNTGVTSLGGASGAISLGNGLAISGGVLRNSGVNSLSAGTPNLTVVNDGQGNLTISSVGGGTGTVSSPGGTPGRIAKFTGVQTIEDSLLSESGATVTINGNLSVTGTTTLSTPLSVSNGGSGAATLAANGVLVGNGTSPVTSVVAGGAGLCFMSNAGAPSWQACPGGAGVSSLNGLSGALSIANASAAGSTITINDASTSQKGIAQFNSTNFSVASGNVNTIQNIDPTATPTFAGINTNSITPSGALTVGGTGQSLTLQGSNTTITQTNGANQAALTFAAPTANVTYRLQTAAAGTYDVCTTAGNCVGLGGGVTGSGTTDRLAKFTGTNTIGDSLLSESGTLITVNGNLSVTGTTSLSTPLAVTSGGTGANNAAGARSNLGAAASGANSDITSLNGLTTAITVLQGGTGATSLSANGVLLGNGTSPVSSLVAGGAGLCLVSTAGAPSWQACPGSGGVTSVNGETGAITIANASAAAGTITLDDASTSQKGIAQFNATNFTAAAGVINTAQDINVTAAPTFGRLTLSSSQATSPMLLVNNTNMAATGNLIDLQLNGTSEFAVSPTGDLTLNGTINGQTISTAAFLTGTLGVAGNLTTSAALTANSGSITNNLNVGGTTSTNDLSVVNNAGVAGDLNVTGTTTTNTITNTGALSVGVTNQSFTLQGNAASTITATDSGNTTGLTFETPTANVTYRLLTAAAGTYDICTTAGNCAGTGGGVTTPGGTTNRIAKFSGSQTLTDSIITDNGTTVSIGGTLAVNTITPSAAMTVGSTGQNLTLQGADTSLSATAGGITNTLTFAAPSGSNKTITIPDASGTVAVSATGPLQLSAAGVISCPTCVTSGGGGGGVGAVDSLNGLTGALSIANASGSGATVTIDDASTSQKGIAQFNATNFSVTGGIVNTVQDINTTAAPQFGRLTVTSSQASNDMLVVNNTNGAATGSLLELQLNGANRFAVDAAGNVVANGTLTSGAINGQTISSTASFTGTVAVAGLASLNGGAVVTGTLTANTITPTSSLTIGAGSQSFTLQGNASSTIAASDSGNTTSLAFQTPTANVTYRFLTAPAGTYDVCTTAGNCVGLGNAITGTGTPGTIAKFTSSGVIADSLLSESGGVVTVGGHLNLSSGSQYRINGNQISSADLSNDANLAKLNATQTFTGATNTFQNGTDSSNSFSIQNAAGRGVLRANTTTGSVVLGNITSTVGQGLAGTLVFADGTNDNFGLTLNTTTLTANRTVSLPNEDGVLCIQGSSACGFVTGTSSDLIQNQNASDQTANFRINGIGRVGTALQAPLIDTATAAALNIGTTNATAINLNKATTVTGNFTQSSGNFSSTSTAAASLTAGGALTLTGGAASTWSTTSGNLTIQAPASNTLSLQTNGTGTVNIGVSSSNAINIGTGTNIARTITIGNNSGGNQAQAVTIGDVGGTSSTTIQGGTGTGAINFTTGTNGSINATTTGSGNINLNTASSVIAKSTTNSASAFAVQNATSGSLLNVDTTNGGVVTLLGNNSGEISSWSTATNGLPAGASDHVAVTTGGYIYVVNGTAVYYTKINADGSVGTWTTSGNSLPSSRVAASAVTANGYIYVMGGILGGTGAMNTVYYTKINADGSIGSWQTANTLPAVRGDGTAVIANGYVYYVGGFDNAVRQNIYYAKLNADGSLGAWQTEATNILPTVGRYRATSVYANGYLYVLGGPFGGSDTSYARLNADGSVGTWTNVTSNLPAIREDATSVVSNGYVYLIGGSANSGTTGNNTVYYAKLNANGSLGSWQTSANTLPTARCRAASVIVNGYGYVLGGNAGGGSDCGNTTSQTTAYYARMGGTVQIGGNLDLIGLQGQNLGDAGTAGMGSTGGSITAGNIMGVGTLDIQGAATFKDSVTVKNNLSVDNIFNADAANIRVQIGSAVADGTGALLVLDTKNTSGDPTGVNGAMYYNSNTGKFRCYQAGVWYDCLGLSSDYTRANPIYFTDFVDAFGTSIDSYGGGGGFWMGSPINNTAGVAFSGGFPTAPSAGVATANTPGVIRIRSGSNTDSGYKYGNSNTQLITGGEQYEVIFNPATLTNSTMRFGFYDAPPPLNVVDGAYLGVSGGIMFGRTASDDGGAGGNTATGTSFNLVAGTWYRARVTVNSNATRVDFYLYNLSGTQLWTDNVTTNIPTASGRETGSGVSAMNSAASTNIVHLDYMAQWWDKPLVR